MVLEKVGLVWTKKWGWVLDNHRDGFGSHLQWTKCESMEGFRR